MNLYTQADPRWGHDDMAEKGDTLAKYGCLLTAVVNCINIHQASDKLTPGTANKMVIDGKGYFGLDNPKTPDDQYSFLHYANAGKALGVTLIPNQPYFDDKIGMIGRIELPGIGGHYINLIGRQGSKILAWDTYFGYFRSLGSDEITTMIGVKA